MDQHDTALTHHGIRGMKWGVRRFQDEDGSLKRAGVIRQRQNRAKLESDAEDDDIVIKKGQEFKRASNSDEADPSKGGKHAYVAYRKSDVDAYASYLEGEYQITFKAKENIVSPSERKRVDTFIGMLDLDKKTVVSEMARSKHENALLFRRSQKGYERAFLKMSEKKLREKGYLAFQQSLVDSAPNRELFFEALKKQGYNAVIDDNDVRNGLAKSPLIIFDRNKSIQRTGAVRLTASARDKAWDRAYESSKKENAKIRAYKKEHPGTKKSDISILQILEGGQK